MASCNDDGEKAPLDNVRREFHAITPLITTNKEKNSYMILNENNPINLNNK